MEDTFIYHSLLEFFDSNFISPSLILGEIEALELCPKLESLDLSKNCLEEVENFECCKNLWRINLSNNKVIVNNNLI